MLLISSSKNTSIQFIAYDKEVSRAKLEEGLEIELKTAKELIDE